MESLFDKRILDSLIARINKLTPATGAGWGKMEAAQMLAHCNAAIQGALGRTHDPRVFIGRIFAPFMKSLYYSDKPYGQGTPTAPGFIITGERDFEKEKQELIANISEFQAGGAEKVTKTPNPFFGKLTPEQWAMGQYKHIDHHLRQFGV